jgi:serine/threonine-protein kinase
VTERRCRKAETETGPEGSRGPATLPPDVLKAGAERIWMFALVNAAVVIVFMAFFFAAGTYRPAHLRATISLLVGFGELVLSLGLFAIARSGNLPAEDLLDRALVYEVLMAFLLGVSFHALPFSADVPPRGWSGVAVWTMVCAFMIPTTRGKNTLATLASSAMDPAGFLVNLAAGAPVPPPMHVAALFLPTAIAAAASLIASRILYKLAADAGKARETGSYRLVSLIGRGGMGEVWKAEHRMLARPAAVKMIRPGGGDIGRRESLARLEREARAMAALRSPHTVQVYDFGITDDGSFYYAMELLEGLSLDQLVHDLGPISPARTVYLLRQACRSLAEAHAAGLVHRDVKPANVFVCRYGLDDDFVKVLDFGLVKAVAGEPGTELTATGMLTGTPSFMSPEIALGKREVDGRSDLYSLGCVGYWLLTGETVFGRGTPMEVIHDHAKTPPPRLSTKASQPVPVGLEDVLMSCLAKDPSDRPDSALELDRRLGDLGLETEWTTEHARRWWDRAPAGGTDRPAAEPTLDSGEAPEPLRIAKA